MDRYYTVMIVPEREKGVRSFRIPKNLFRSLAFLFVLSLTLLSILAYDYWKVMLQIYENKHLKVENRQLKEQIQIFQMKINSLSQDIERIYTFENKLRIITGLSHDENSTGANVQGRSVKKMQEPVKQDELEKFKDDFQSFNMHPEYEHLKELYEDKIATTFGHQVSYAYTKQWSELSKQSFALASQYAEFDFKYKLIQEKGKELELRVSDLESNLLDRDSFLKSTPTILPTEGWITSYYGPRKSPYSGKVRMHEGIDIGANKGTDVIAPADGVVVLAGHKPGFGRFVQIDHGYGIETIFGHNEQLIVSKGQILKRGDLIAKVGSTGLSTGPHVHYEVRVNGIAVDPLYFVLD